MSLELEEVVADWPIGVRHAELTAHHLRIRAWAPFRSRRKENSLPRYIGLDLHKRVLEVCILDHGGRVEHRLRLAVDRDSLLKFAQRDLRLDDYLAVEATTNTWPVVTLLRPYVADITVSNPMATKAIACAKVKTDKIDAQTLAQLLRADFLPSVWQPDAQTARLRQLTNQRASLVSDRISIKNRIHALLHQRLIPPAAGRLFDERGRRWLDELEIDPDGRSALRRDLHLLDELERAIAELDQMLFQLAGEDPRIKLLITLPGVDVACAQTLLAALGDLSRFADGDHAAAYLGLVPSTKQSAEHAYHGPITKAGNTHAGWMLIEAAQHLGTNPGPLGAFFRRLAHKKNRNVAVVATARKLVTIAYLLLTVASRTATPCQRRLVTNSANYGCGAAVHVVQRVAQRACDQLRS